MISVRSFNVIGLLLLLAALTLTGCASFRNPQKLDPYVITHPTWWNYYQRGRLYLKDGDYDAARRDFETALGRIPGARYPYAQDRWRVRTYGMHMLESYFPHRELGICLYNLNRPAEALQLLETSMRMEPSARAKFYLNRIHGQMAMEAASPPTLQITPLPPWTAERRITVQGTASGSNPVIRLVINDAPEFIELATRTRAFRKELPLHEGSNEIRILAEDVAGKQATTNLMITADWTPPRIALRRNGAELILDCEDNLELRHIQLDSQRIEPVDHSTSYTCPIRPDKPLNLTVTDRAGNRTDWSLTEKELAYITQHHEASPPGLHIGNEGQTLVQIQPEYGLDLNANDDAALKSLKLNGTELLSRATPLFRSFCRLPLETGTNTLTLVAEDFDGNRTECQVTVVHRSPVYLDSVYRMTALQSPLSGEIENPTLARNVARLIEENITIDPVRFYLLASDTALTGMQQELALSESALADPRALLKEGRKLDADLVLIPRMLDDAPGRTVYAEILDARSGKELFIEDVYVEDPAMLPSQITGLVMKIEQRFPLITGSVQRDGNSWSINAGLAHGARKGMRLLVIRSDGAFEQGHLVLDRGRPLELVISEVEPGSSKVILADRNPEESVLPGDYVFSR